MNVNQAAFCTSVPLSTATIACTYGAATSVTTISTVAFAIFATLGFAFSIAAITAWITLRGEEQPGTEKTGSDYWDTFVSHAGFTTVGVLKFVATTFFTALIQGAAEGTGNNIRRRIGGADFTFSQV